MEQNVSIHATSETHEVNRIASSFSNGMHQHAEIAVFSRFIEGKQWLPVWVEGVKRPIRSIDFLKATKKEVASLGQLMITIEPNWEAMLERQACRFAA